MAPGAKGKGGGGGGEDSTPVTGFNPTLTIVLLVIGVVALVLIANYTLYSYAQKMMPPRKKKAVSKKKLKKERLKKGVPAPGE